MKYIQNTYTADIGITIKDNGRFVKTITFERYQLDKASGQVVSDGFTEVNDEDLKLLEANGAYQLLVKKGKLAVKDEAPLKAGSFEQMLALKERVKALEAENKALQEEVKSLKEAAKKGDKDKADKAGGKDKADKADADKAGEAKDGK